MKKRDEILGIMLPDQHNTYLLPNVSIAEIFTLDNTRLVHKPEESSEGFTHCKVLWRQRELVLFHLNEHLSDKFKIPDVLSIEKPRIAVVNPITQQGEPIYAILATNTPRLTRLKSQNLHNYTELPKNNAISYKAKLYQDEVHIPDLMFLESTVRNSSI